jgi:hypothetical protein
MTQAYPLHWPENWPRTQRPGKSQFKTTLPGAIKNVQNSLQLFAKDSEKRVEGLMVSCNVSLMDSNPKDAGVAVYFTWDGISTCIAVDRYQRIEENLQAIHHVIEAERTKLRHGGLNLVRAAFRGYAALPPPRSASKRPAHEVLGVRPGATPEEIDAAYRQKAKAAHPDNGGSAAAMQELNDARAALKGRSA